MTTPSTGSNRAQWDAMDLRTTPASRRYYAVSPPALHPSASSTRSGLSTSRRDATPSSNTNTNPAGTAATASTTAGLTARNLMLRRKLQERRRFDSADDAMQKFMEAAQSNATANAKTNAVQLVRAISAPVPSASTPGADAAPVFARGRMGASLFSSAMEHSAQSQAQAPSPSPSPASAPAPAPAPSSRYGALGHPSASNALSARNILIQKKMQVKKKFDSADWQLERQQRTQGRGRGPSHSPLPSPLTGERSSSPSPRGDGYRLMEDESDVSTAPSSPMEVEAGAASFSPLATSDSEAGSPVGIGMDAAARRARARMSPATRGGSSSAASKYGQLGEARTQGVSSGPGPGPSASQILCRRRLEGSRGLKSSRMFPGSPMQGSPIATLVEPGMSPPLAPVAAGAGEALRDAIPDPGRPSKYGRLGAANVMLRRHLQDRKYFDSGEYFMEREQQRRSEGEATQHTDDSNDDNSTQAASPSNYGTMAMSAPERAASTRPAWRYKPRS